MASARFKSPFTCQRSVHSLYGYPAEMETDMLPTAREVACHFLLSKDRPNESIKLRLRRLLLS